jgi:hypothetical protein
MGVGNTLQAVGNFKATMGLYASPFIALIFCCCGYFLIRQSKVTPPALAPAPAGQPAPSKPPPAAMGYCFICLGFLVPLLAYGIYKLTMSSPTFSKISGADTLLQLAR